MLSASVIIPTYNRPAELEDCLGSILIQTRLPQEIVVVDDGELDEIPLRKRLEAAGIRCVYLRKQTPGLTASRNAGIEIAHGDIVFFFDDDVVLEPNYIEETLMVYRDDRQRSIMGVGGLVANHRPLGFWRRLRYLYDLVFCIKGLREGRILASGFCTDYWTTLFPLRRLSRVDFLAGCAMSFRRQVFEEFQFSDRFHGYGLGEDKDFTFRVAKKHTLVVTPDSRLDHYESPAMRIDKKAKGRDFVLSNYLFFREHVRQKRWHDLLFWYALSGYILRRGCIAALSVKRENFAQMQGIVGAVRDILAGRLERVGD